MVLTESSSQSRSQSRLSSLLTHAEQVLNKQKIRTHTHASGSTIGDKVKQYLGPRIVNGVVQDTAIQLFNTMHWQLREKLSEVIWMTVHRALGRSLTESLTPSVTESVSEVLNAALRLQLTRECTHVLTRSLTLTLTPALGVILSRAITRAPQADYYCYLCKNPLDNFPEKPAFFHLDPPAGSDPATPYCQACKDYNEHEYYVDYYAAYYARYYGGKCNHRNARITSFSFILISLSSLLLL